MCVLSRVFGTIPRDQAGRGSIVRVSVYETKSRVRNEITKSHVRSIPCVGLIPRVFEQRVGRLLQELFGSCRMQSWKHGLLRSDSPVRQISFLYVHCRAGAHCLKVGMCVGCKKGLTFTLLCFAWCVHYTCSRPNQILK